MSKQNNTQHALYNTWRKIKEKHYNQYIDVIMCVDWMLSFQNFSDDVGEKPGVDYYLKRIYMNKSYGPKNFRWIKRKVYNKLTPERNDIQVDRRDDASTITNSDSTIVYDIPDLM